MYKIEVSQEGGHLFTTEGMELSRVKTLLAVFYTKFLRSDGYECRVGCPERWLDESELLSLEVRQANPKTVDADSLEKCPLCDNRFPRSYGWAYCEECSKKFPN